jgi:predicted GNAT superfamily acetyltransferase
MTLESSDVARNTRRSSETNPLVEIRPLSSQSDLRACVEMQREIWGDDFVDVVPASILKITTQVGGIVAGAFDPGESMLGFVYGITGVKDGEIAHWSHMLGVTAGAQRQGIGRALKQYQRAELKQLGVVTMYWTFDPLVARNAHFNFNVLGVRAKGYVAHMYGEGTSPLHRGIGTDRLIVSWPVNGTQATGRHAMNVDLAHAIKIRIPDDIGALQKTDMPKAREWRERSREAFQRALAEGMSIAGFEFEPDTQSGVYLLTRDVR